MRQLRDKVTIYEFKGTTFTEVLREAAKCAKKIENAPGAYVLNMTFDFQDDGSWLAHLYTGTDSV